MTDSCTVQCDACAAFSSGNGAASHNGAGGVPGHAKCAGCAGGCARFAGWGYARGTTGGNTRCIGCAGCVRAWKGEGAV